MTTTRRSWIKSLVAMACGAFGYSPKPNGGFSAPLPFRNVPPFSLTRELGPVTLLIDGEKIADEMVADYDFYRSAESTGWKQCADSWISTFTPSRVATMRLMLRDGRIVAVLLRDVSESDDACRAAEWRVEQCICTNNRSEIIL